MVLMVADDVTGGLSAGIYAWDLKATDADGIVRYYVGGKLGWFLPSRSDGKCKK